MIFYRKRTFVRVLFLLLCLSLGLLYLFEWQWLWLQLWRVHVSSTKSDLHLFSIRLIDKKAEELVSVVEMLKVTYQSSIRRMKSGVYLHNISGNYYFLGEGDGENESNACIMERNTAELSYLNLPIRPIHEFHSNQFFINQSTRCSFETQSKLLIRKDSAPNILFIIYTHNHLEKTIKILQTFRHLSKTIDVLFFDEHSTDGTPSYLLKRGYAVLFQNTSMKSGNFWDIGLRIAISMGYKKAILTHNRNILPVSSVELITKSLDNEMLVFPLMSQGPPIQSLLTTFKLKDIYTDYINDPQNADIIQRSLVNRMGSEPSLIDLSSNETSFAFFGVNLTGYFLSPTIETLSNRASTMRPKLCLNCFVNNWFDENESQNFPEKSLVHLSNMATTLYNPYPHTHSHIIIGCAISNPVKNPSAGDIFTSREFASGLLSKYKVSIQYLFKDTSWYLVDELDILVVFLDGYSLSKMVNPKPGLITIAWMRNWFQKWLELKWIGNYDCLLASSNVATKFFSSFQAQSLRIATNTTTFSPRSGEKQSTFDYVFTGNYWNSPREIMQFNPLNLSEFQGAVYGKGWQKAPVSEAWKKMIRGVVPYSKLPEIYRSTKIVIDDANHVTKPWGSVNSRVFDALACGSLVITNGDIGSLDTFNKELPTYDGITDLQNKLRYYLTHDRERLALVKRLQQQVIQSHSYGHRADEFGDIVNSIAGATILHRRTPNEPSVSFSFHCPSVCIGVRTYPSQEDWLDILLSGLLVQSQRSQYSKELQLKIFLVNTETQFNSSLEWSQFESRLMTSIDVLNKRYEDRVKFLRSRSTSPRVFKNPFYGYDETDKLLDYLLLQKECEWIMFTNGDNMYHAKWFDAIVPYALNTNLDIIAWDFISHHIRKQRRHQPIIVDIKRKFIDLGSVMLRRSALMGHHFLPESLFTSDLFARDYFMIQEIFDSLIDPNRTRVKLIHELLLFHQ